MKSRIYLIPLIFGAVILAFVAFFKEPSPVPSEEIQSTQAAPVVATPEEKSAVTTKEKLIQSVSLSAARKLMLLDEIIASKNDNDPRLDTEFKNLSDEERSTLIKRYAVAVPEHLNERGTLVFLVGREAKTPEDLQFLQSVLNEKPCLSLDDCSRESKQDAQVSEADADHGDMGASTTLAYPQIVAIEMLKKSARNGSLTKASVIAALEKAKRSESAKVVAFAEAALAEMGDSP